MAFVGGQAGLDKSGDLPRRPKWYCHRKRRIDRRSGSLSIASAPWRRS